MIDVHIALSDQDTESQDTFDLFLRIEEEYDVTISNEEIEELISFQKIIDHINTNLNS